MINVPDANDLLLFARVAEAGSFTRAAKRVGLPKSTVSRRVAALERQVGERLLLRTTRQLNLTEIGQAVLEHARALAEEVDATAALALHRQSEPSGRLRVSMTNDVAEYLADSVIAPFVERYPLVALELDLTPRRVDLIGEGFDLALRWGDLPDDATLTARRICTMGVGLYAAPAYLARQPEPRAPAELMALHSLQILSRDGMPMPWTLQRGRDGETPERWQGLPPPRALINSPSVLLQLAAAGLGIVAVADWQATPWLARGALRRVLPDWCLPPVPGWAVLPGRRLMPAKTGVFIAELERALNAR